MDYTSLDDVLKGTGFSLEGKRNKDILTIFSYPISWIGFDAVEDQRNKVNNLKRMSEDLSLPIPESLYLLKMFGYTLGGEGFRKGYFNASDTSNIMDFSEKLLELKKEYNIEDITSIVDFFNKYPALKNISKKANSLQKIQTLRMPLEDDGKTEYLSKIDENLSDPKAKNKALYGYEGYLFMQQDNLPNIKLLSDIGYKESILTKQGFAHLNEILNRMRNVDTDRLREVFDKNHASYYHIMAAITALEKNEDPVRYIKKVDALGDSLNYL